MPSGVAFRNGALFVAEQTRVSRYDDIEKNLLNPPHPVLVSDRFKPAPIHGWKFIAFGPDGKLYVPVGFPCNICQSEDPQFGTIIRMNPDGTDFESFAAGIRNSVGFDWHPLSKELWFTDNGRDDLGEDIPPDELNHAPRKDMNFGFPECYGNGIPDPRFGKTVDCAKVTAPAKELGPHVAALGMRFYTGAMFPPEYANTVFIAEHGSINRKQKIGYRVTVARVENNRVVSYEPFAAGWLQGNTEWGRPADVLVMPDGSLLVSDDAANAIYRITYRK
jgi:glucose/arabinose dehydrogenase